MKVLKFGGTSVGNPLRMKQVADIIANEHKPLVVLSAVAGTTNKLVDIAWNYNEGKKQQAITLCNELRQSYEPFISELYNTSEKYNQAQKIINSHFDFISNIAEKGFGLKQYKEILAQGELISTQLFYLFMLEQGKNTVLLNALDFMRIDEDGEPVMKYIEEKLNELINKHRDADYLITQGFICRNPMGEIDNLKRGGSDYTASLCGAAINSPEVQIWTDIDGMHNNDPRIVKNTFPVRELSFDEAAELAYFGAKILHPSTINPARSKGIPVRLKNTMQPDAPGTLISEKSNGNSITAIAAKDNIIAIKIKSSRMLMAYGFLRSVFEVFEQYKTPIDVITTSEVAVSVTIDNDKHLNEIIEDLKKYASVEVEKNQTIICIVGDLLQDKPGYAAKIFQSLVNIPVRMVSYGGSKNNITVLVAAKHKEEALNALNEGLFSSQLTHA
jgi:aspartate kinase